MGNNAVCNVVGVGSVRIRMFDGMVYTLLNVHHVSDMKKNLISVGALVSDGSRCILDKDGFVITKGSQVVMMGKKKESLYELVGSMDNGLAWSKGSLLSDEHHISLWHLRHGHMSKRDLGVLSKNDLFGEKCMGSIGSCKLGVLYK